jgi:signal transduction histidine kinase
VHAQHESSPSHDFDEVLSALPETIVQVDTDHTIVHVNRPESAVFRVRASVGTRLDDVIVPEAREALAGLVDNAQFTGGALAEFRTGNDLFRVTAKPLGGDRLALLVFKNITGIRSAGQTIVELVRDRSNFLAAVSHELRTPLTAVVGYANLLAESTADLDEDVRSDMVRDMTDQAWDLAGIIEDLLTVASAELGELHVANVGVSLGANVAQVLESMGTRGTAIYVEQRTPVTGSGDPARFRQVVRNLLSNALKHGSGPIRVIISDDGGGASLQVRDQGGGISRELEELINQQAAQGRNSTPGTMGLGLWICQELTRLMGGSLSYRRVDGETSFKVTIPVS